jgi:hypothetical protein
MRRLIVNADDFGLSDGVNEGIIEAHLDGLREELEGLGVVLASYHHWPGERAS